MRRFIIKILLRLLSRQSYEVLSEQAIQNMMINLKNTEGLERFPDFLQQCADTYRNQYLYTGEVMFKGAVLALLQVREQLLSCEKKKKKLTEDEKHVKNKIAY